jgi:hypothetical protein
VARIHKEEHLINVYGADGWRGARWVVDASLIRVVFVDARLVRVVDVRRSGLSL